MDEAEDYPARRRRPRLRRGVSYGALAIVLGAVAIGWVQREPITRSFVDDELAARGIPARYDVATVGVTAQRLENVVIGDPARPDLTADWVEIRLDYGFGLPTVGAVRAGGVRVRGRYRDGALSFGSFDRLRPAPSGEPTRLPDIDLDLTDARMRLDSDYGPAGFALNGRGNLADGFRGRLAAVAPLLAQGDCVANAANAFLTIATSAGRPTITGPIRAGRIACAGVTAEQPELVADISLTEDLAGWKGTTKLDIASLARGSQRLKGLSGVIGLDGTAKATRGAVMLTSGRAETAQGWADRLAVNGNYSIAPGAGLVDSDLDIQFGGLALARDGVRTIDARMAALDGTPLAPVAGVIGQAVRRAAQRTDARLSIVIHRTPADGTVRLAQAEARALSGAVLSLSGGSGVTWGWPAGLMRLDGTMRLAGGGFPDTAATLRQPEAEALLEGEVRIAPVATAGGRLALSPVRITGEGGVTRFVTRATIDGPVGDGRVRGLALPVDGRIAANGALIVNPGCVAVNFARLELAGLAIGASRMPLCPTRAALLRVADGGLSGGGAIARPRLNGRLGGEPITLAARALRFDLGRAGFAAEALAVRLGEGEGATRLDVASLTGDTAPGGLAGRFTDAAGRIVNVPLLLSGGEGRWRLANAALALDATLTVADDNPDPRFVPLAGRDVRLSVDDGVIAATGVLVHPASGIALSDVTIRHVLASGRGGAVLDVPGVTFTEAFQPEMVTRLTLGVIANVAGRVAGRGTIDWSPEGVTSGGTFATREMDLAAAFGPVTGLSGEVRFTDLLNLETGPGQVATIREINPGVAVTDGVIAYQLLSGQRVKVESGRWPFAGGTLTLEPTVMDFGQPVERRMTFRVDGLDAATFIQRFDFDNVSATGTFDGVLPIVFSNEGGRIENGRLAVRQGGGELHYVGEVSNADLGTFGKMAFDALKAIRYDGLAIELDGLLDGELISRIVFTGVNEAPVGGEGPAGIAKSFTGLPFRFNIAIKAPFRGLLSTAQSYVDPTGLIRQQQAVQDQESGARP